jgi:pimeloyl-ACP methyl ester carboxylesterase
MRTHLIHGFNVRDNGGKTTGALAEFLRGEVIEHPYGWGRFPLMLPRLFFVGDTNRRAISRIADSIQDGDFIIAHSNGCLIAWELCIMLPGKIAGVVCVNPSMRGDTTWPIDVPVLCLYNSRDWVVQLGRAWSRLVSLGGFHFHGWGAAGRYGFWGLPPGSDQIDVAEHRQFPSTGHSAIFKPPVLVFWATVIRRWCALTRARQGA